MSKTHDDFDLVIRQLGFREDITGKYDWIFYDGTWRYMLRFEGYAYVLYKQINLYITPFMNLFWIFNKFKKGDAQINLYYGVPIAHFRDAQKLVDIMKILTDKLEDDDNDIPNL